MRRTTALMLCLLLASCTKAGPSAESGGDFFPSGELTAGSDAGAGSGARSESTPFGEGGLPGDPTDPSLPKVHNHTATRPDRVATLVRRAIEGLGFADDDPSRPLPEDRFFVGRYTMVWIDQTGFYGKPNGLWRLNGKAGEDLDFVLQDPEGRPVSLLVVGEDGDGRWPEGYKGAEHVEFPNRTPELNDLPICGSFDWCNQFSLAEAAPITDPDLPWWRACNDGSPSWNRTFAPVVEEEIPGGLKLVYEGPLVKEADGDKLYDGDACHTDYLFEDKVRRRVYLRLGLELFDNATYFDRTQQLRNPEGNPELKGAMSLIGGFVITSWPLPNYLKHVYRFLRPEEQNVNDAVHGGTLGAGEWSAHPRDPTGKDEIFAWLKQPLSLSAAAGYAEGQTLTIANVGPSDNDDVGACLCSVHGGLEMGGGLVHAGISLPIASGTTSIEAKRRLTLPGEGGLATKLGAHTYRAEQDLRHEIGRAESGGWSANTASDAEASLAYGPYATDWGGGTAQANFYLMIDNITADDLPVVTVDAFDATANQVISQRILRRHQFRSEMAYQRFPLNMDLAGRAGHQMEVRVRWHDVAYVRLERVTVFTSEQ